MDLRINSKNVFVKCHVKFSRFEYIRNVIIIIIQRTGRIKYSQFIRKLDGPTNL